MDIKNNYSLTQLFATKDITIWVDGKSFLMHLPTLRDLYKDTRWNNIFFLWTRTPKEAQKYYYQPINSSYDIIQLIIFDAVQYQEYIELCKSFQKYIEKLFDNVEYDYQQKLLVINGITITTEIWDHILYLLRLSNGEKVTQPPVFDSEEARKLYLAQQEAEERIRKIKSKAAGDKDGLMKAFLAITYSFPSLTIDYLFDQTMAQIQWLQKHAAGAVSYEVNAQAYAAGNVKKGKKLDFFIK